VTRLPLSPQVFAILSALVEERAGLHYSLSSFELFASKVSQRAGEAGFESLLDYYYFLRYDATSNEEFNALLDALVINETHFYREADQLTILVNDILLPVVRAGQRPRIWCAACATGEEPLTLAMMLAERDILDKVEVVATDVSRRALARARDGVYGARALRALPPSARRWFVSSGAEHRVAPSLQAAITWRRVNLVKSEEFLPLGTFDAIICRNVLIYFSEATTRGVMDSLAALLRPGGHLLVGASESLLRLGTLLRCEERGGAFFYTKVLDG
jgi:chemotaxis protein methyltransferase CheR